MMTPLTSLKTLKNHRKNIPVLIYSWLCLCIHLFIYFFIYSYLFIYLFIHSFILLLLLSSFFLGFAVGQEFSLTTETISSFKKSEEDFHKELYGWCGNEYDNRKHLYAVRTVCFFFCVFVCYYCIRMLCFVSSFMFVSLWLYFSFCLWLLFIDVINENCCTS
jgi:hypothetical protein